MIARKLLTATLYAVRSIYPDSRCRPVEVIILLDDGTSLKLPIPADTAEEKGPGTPSPWSVDRAIARLRRFGRTGPHKAGREARLRPGSCFAHLITSSTCRCRSAKLAAGRTDRAALPRH